MLNQLLRWDQALADRLVFTALYIILTTFMGVSNIYSLLSSHSPLIGGWCFYTLCSLFFKRSFVIQCALQMYIPFNTRLCPILQLCTLHFKSLTRTVWLISIKKYPDQPRKLCFWYSRTQELKSTGTTLRFHPPDSTPWPQNSCAILRVYDISEAYNE